MPRPPRRSRHSSGRAPSRSWTLAAVTTIASSSPRVSTARWRFRPLTFGGVVAAALLGDGVGGPHRLGVDDRRARNGVGACDEADLGAELVVQCAGGAAGVPAPVEPVYGAPGREVTGQGPPHAAVMGHIADGVDDVAPMMRLWPATSAVDRSRCWQQRLQQRPFGIGGVGGVAPRAIGRDRRRR
jgi:hypothetical protein